MWHPACRDTTGPFFKLDMPLPEDNSNTHDSSLASTSDDMPTATLAILPLHCSLFLLTSPHHSGQGKETRK